jgi:PIN domain nuclease of toxin-antitoxin system
MNLLLDTHILIWSVGAPDRLGDRTRTLLEDEGTASWLSPISTWECLVFAKKGKVSLKPNPVEWVRKVLKEHRFKQAPLNHEVAIKSRLVQLAHQDPADRFLAATAAVYNLTLLTADDRLLKGRGYSVLANR